MSMYEDFVADHAYEMNNHGGVAGDVWTTKNGTRVKVCDMSDDHIRNCMKMLGEGCDWYDRFAAELEARKVASALKDCEVAENEYRSAAADLMKGFTRPSKESYYLGIAEQVAKRSTCLRRQYGAVIVKNDEIISTGYNGAARGETNCCDAGVCWREAHGIPHGQQYERCVAVHAEQNAIISAARRDMIGATLYLAGFRDGIPLPYGEVKSCLICQRMIQNAGITKIVTRSDVTEVR